MFSANTNIFPKIRIGQVKELPIKQATQEEQQPFIAKADEMLQLNKKIQKVSAKFKRTLQRRLFSVDVSKEQFSPMEHYLPMEHVPLKRKLETWHTLSFAKFVKELKNKKIKLSLSKESDWEDYFLAEQTKALAIKNQITQTDKQIDAMVYELYGLNEAEIAIIKKLLK